MTKRWVSVDDVSRFEIGQPYLGGVVWCIDRLRGRIMVVLS